MPSTRWFTVPNLLSLARAGLLVPVLWALFNDRLLLAFGLFWLAAGISKVTKGWMTTDLLREIFLDRLTEMPPDAFASIFLVNIGLPLYIPLAMAKKR